VEGYTKKTQAATLALILCITVAAERAIIDMNSNNGNAHIEQSLRNANANWKLLANAALLKVAGEVKEFTSTEIFQELQKTNACTHDKRAVGGVLLRAQKEGIIEPIGYVRHTSEKNRSVTRVWRAVKPCQKQADPVNKPEVESESKTSAEEPETIQ